jgi:multidrug efflux pump
MRSMPEFENVSSDLELNGRQLKMTIDRATAARFGITPASIDNALYDRSGSGSHRPISPRPTSIA